MSADSSTRRRVIIYAIVLVAAVLIGLVPMWLVARERGAEARCSAMQLRLCHLENDFAETLTVAGCAGYRGAQRSPVDGGGGSPEGDGDGDG